MTFDKQTMLFGKFRNRHIYYRLQVNLDQSQMKTVTQMRKARFSLTAINLYIFDM